MSWTPINSYGLETAHGYRTFEVWHGDIADPPEALPGDVELVVVSAFQRDYTPTSSSVIGALARRKIDVAALACAPEVDLRGPLGVWLSRRLPTGAPYRRVLCVEIAQANALSDTLRDMFATLSFFESREEFAVRSESSEAGGSWPAGYGVTLPLLGTGDQALGLEEVLTALLPAARRAMHASAWLQRVRFVAYSKGDAEALGADLDLLLGRAGTTLPAAALRQGLRDELLDAVTRAPSAIAREPVLSELRHALRSGDLRAYQLGAVARKLAEVAAVQVLRRRGLTKIDHELDKKITQLQNAGVASWMAQYFHVLRVFGNEQVHHKERDRRPSTVVESDLAVALHCLQRVLAFWSDEVR
jgi:hypothetical protein